MEEIGISNVRAATAEEWDSTWEACDYATFFHSRAWAEIWRDYTDGFDRPAPQVVEFSDNTAALLPFTVQKRKKLITNHFLTAEGQYGNWISGHPLTQSHFTLLVEYLARNFENLVWRWNPYDPWAFNPILDNVYEIEEDRTHAVNLSQGFENVFLSCSHGHQCSFRKAVKEGLAVNIAASPGEWEEYHKIYKDCVRRWGESALSDYEWPLFDAMFRRDPEHTKLWLVFDHSAIIAGALCFYAKKHVVCWHAAALEKCFAVRPMHRVFLEIMRDASEKGYTWFDFNTSADLDGVKTFKKRFGAQELPCNVIYHKTRFVRGVIKVKGFFNKWGLTPGPARSGSCSSS